MNRTRSGEVLECGGKEAEGARDRSGLRGHSFTMKYNLRFLGQADWLGVVVVCALAPFLAAGAASNPAAASGGSAKLLASAPTSKDVLPPLEKASWIWRHADDTVIQARSVFTLEERPSAASILITADNGYELYVNGAFVGADVGAAGDVWQSVERYDLTARLARGRNVIGVRGTDLGGVRGLIAAARIEVTNRPPLEIVTDAHWRVALESEPADYAHPEYVENAGWSNATVLGPMGLAPWGKVAFSEEVARNHKPSFQGAAVLVKPDASFKWPEGLAFLGDDCSVYVPQRGDAWGLCFRVQDWSRAYTEFDIPCPSKIGRKLYLAKPLGPGTQPRLLLDAGKGAIGSPSVSYDGRSLLVAMAREGESFFHIYRVPIEGGAPERLTDGPYHDLDPAELPDGRIVFASTRIGSFEEYHNPPSRALCTMQADGSGIQQLTFTPIFDNEPKVMADGRIAFIRTDNFFDRAKVETQIHVIRPDGTDGLMEIGADPGADYGVRLRAFGYGSPAPMPDGRLACISSRGNFVCPPGGNEASYHRLPDRLGDLAPMPDGRLLATVLRAGGPGMKSDVIAVIDPHDDKLVTVHQSAAGSVHSPVFVGARPRPPVLVDSVDRLRAGQPGATGFLYCQDARFTRKTKADWAQIRAIRVLGALALTTRSSHSHIVHAGHQTVELGTVPLAPDGSFYIEIPADMPVALQAVNAEGRSELNEMSWIYVRPGEKRSCLGCHHPREASPPLRGVQSLALKTPALKLLGQGQPHRFRGNNSGVTGMMDLQFERFRETASLNRDTSPAGPLSTGRDEVTALIAQLRGGDEALKISAAQRLALFRDRAAAPALAERLQDENREARIAAALALATCGTRDSVPPLLDALEAADPLLAQAAVVALENLTESPGPFATFADPKERRRQASVWREWFEKHDWPAIEKVLVTQARGTNRVPHHRGIVALGHVGGDDARAALRDIVTEGKARNPYPPFVNDNRTDNFTFGGGSALNPRTLQEAVRALGYLKDTEAIPLLVGILTNNIEPKTANLFLAEAAIEALGRMATPEAETALIEVFGKLKDYWHYVGWYSDHPALYACHSSPLHARIIAALDYFGSTHAASIVPQLIRSVPTDPDRALFPANDDYEALLGRVIRRSGRDKDVIEACLSLLGDPRTNAVTELRQAISATWPAWAGHPNPENRAAQILSSVCRDATYEARVRAAYERYRAKPEDAIKRPLGNPDWIPQRHWVLFYLGRSLGNLADPRSVEVLMASLKPELNEARHGRPDPSEPNIHFLQLEYTPCWRVTAAWALGRIGDRRATPVLLQVVGDLANATDVRHAAAAALGRLADPVSLESITKLARDYPEYNTGRTLKWAAARMTGQMPSMLLD